MREIQLTIKYWFQMKSMDQHQNFIYDHRDATYLVRETERAVQILMRTAGGEDLKMWFPKSVVTIRELGLITFATSPEFWTISSI